MDRRDGVGIARVHDVHPGPDHVVKGEARLVQRALDDRERGPRLGRRIARVPRLAVRPGVRGPRHEAGVAHGQRPRVAGPRLPGSAAPDVAAAQRAAPSPGQALGPPAADLGIAADGHDQRCQQRRARDDRRDLQVLLRRVVHPADWTQPVERRHAHARRRVRVRRPARDGVVELEPQLHDAAGRRTRTRRAWACRRSMGLVLYRRDGPLPGSSVEVGVDRPAHERCQRR